jgi:MSHA pilin protein MshC
MPAIDSPDPVRPSRPSPQGFTVIEIVVVMVLMSIITAVVLGRSITTAVVVVVGQTDKIRTHLRYAQSMAMKRSDQEVWGIYFNTDEYWFFSGADPTISQIRLPGGDYRPAENVIRFVDLGVNVSTDLTYDKIYFDKFGKPYVDWVDETVNTPLGSLATITISDSGESRTIEITPETGYIE